MRKHRFGETGWRTFPNNTKEQTVAEEDKLKKSLDAVEAVKAPTPLPKLTPPVKTTNTPKNVIGNIAKNIAPSVAKMASVKPAEIKDTFDYDTAMHMAVMGVGQGGGKIAQSFWDLGYRRVGAFNTTDSDFDGLDPELPRVSLDIGGAAKDMKLARNALLDSSEEVYDLFMRAWGSKFDCAMICAGLGGGTGSGTCLPFVQMARKYMTDRGLPPRVGVLLSLPSVDEGQQVSRNAVTAFNELLQAGVSPILIIDNDKIDELYHPSMSQLLPMSNALVSQLFHLFNQLAATKSSNVTFDRAEFTQLMDSGIVVMGSAQFNVDEIKSPADISSKIREELANSVLADVDLRTGTKAACIFVASPAVLDNFSKEYFAAGFTALNRIVASALPEGTETVVHRGIYTGEEGLQCYTMIAGLEAPMKKLQALARVGGITQPAISSSVAKHLQVD